jgi:tetratricopeptide (TPR) repeat protein
MAGRSSEALEYIRNAIALLKATDDNVALGRAYLIVAGLEIRNKSAAEAKHHVSLASSLLGTLAETVDVGMLCVGESRVAALEGDGDTAVEKARDALARLGDFHGGEQGFAVHALATGLVLQGNATGAEDAYRRAVDLLTVHGRRADAGDAALEWANFLQGQGREDEAEPIRRRAYDLGVDAETAAHRKS